MSTEALSDDELAKTLVDYTIDWNGQPIPDRCEPRCAPTCGQLRTAAARLRSPAQSDDELADRLEALKWYPADGPGAFLVRTAAARLRGDEAKRIATDPIVAKLRELLAMAEHGDLTLGQAIKMLVDSHDHIARLGEALVQHNDRLRSAVQIAHRDGADTNWKAFRGQCHYTLAECHEIVNEARRALEGKSDV